MTKFVAGCFSSSGTGDDCWAMVSLSERKEVSREFELVLLSSGVNGGVVVVVTVVEREYVIACFGGIVGRKRLKEDLRKTNGNAFVKVRVCERTVTVADERVDELEDDDVDKEARFCGFPGKTNSGRA